MSQRCASPARAAPCNRAFAGKQSAHANAQLLWSAAGAGRVHALVGAEIAPNRSPCPARPRPTRPLPKRATRFPKCNCFSLASKLASAPPTTRAGHDWFGALRSLRRQRPGWNLVNQRAAASHSSANLLPRHRPPAPSVTDSLCRTLATPTLWLVPR